MSRAMTAASWICCARKGSRPPSSPAANGWRRIPSARSSSSPTHCSRSAAMACGIYDLVASERRHARRGDQPHRGGLRPRQGGARGAPMPMGAASPQPPERHDAAALSVRALQRQVARRRRPMPGCSPIQWDVVTGDPDPRDSAKTIANTILTKAHPGAIIVAHANGRGHNTAEALASPAEAERGGLQLRHGERADRRRQASDRRKAAMRPGPATRRASPIPSPRKGSHDLLSIFDGAQLSLRGSSGGALVPLPSKLLRFPRRGDRGDGALVGDGLSGREARRVPRRAGRRRAPPSASAWRAHEAGVVSVRDPWLKGPYLELLALLPSVAKPGHRQRASSPGSNARRSRHQARNLWVCASSFNTRALRFYERHGFRAGGDAARARRRRL